MILIIDFGAQYSQLIARRERVTLYISLPSSREKIHNNYNQFII
jgi:GMP synthase-like glutamine amidotransferase